MGNSLGDLLSIKQMVYNNLKKRIINGELKPGTRLTEVELTTEMGISRAPIREAFNILEKDGFVNIMPRKGAVVSDITEEDVFSIWQFRLLLEPFAAKTTVNAMTDEEIRDLEKEILYVQEHPEDFERYMESDLALHDLLVKHLQNPFMKATLNNIRSHSLRIRWEDEYTREGARMPETPKAVNQEHMEIVRALISREEDAVYDAVCHHVICSTKRVMSACDIKMTEEQRKSMEACIMKNRTVA